MYTRHCFKGGISGMHTNNITCIESYRPPPPPPPREIEARADWNKYNTHEYMLRWFWDCELWYEGLTSVLSEVGGGGGLTTYYMTWYGCAARTAPFSSAANSTNFQLTLLLLFRFNSSKSPYLQPNLANSSNTQLTLANSSNSSSTYPTHRTYGPTYPTYSTTYPTHRTHPQLIQLIQLTAELSQLIELTVQLTHIIELILNLYNSSNSSSTYPTHRTFIPT